MSLPTTSTHYYNCCHPQQVIALNCSGPIVWGLERLPRTGEMLCRGINFSTPSRKPLGSLHIRGKWSEDSAPGTHSPRLEVEGRGGCCFVWMPGAGLTRNWRTNMAMVGAAIKRMSAARTREISFNKDEVWVPPSARVHCITLGYKTWEREWLWFFFSKLATIFTIVVTFTNHVFLQLCDFYIFLKYQ